MKRCNIETGRQAPAAADPANEHLRVLTVRVETDRVSPAALDDFKRDVPGQLRHWAGHDDEGQRDFAWYVHPDALPAVKTWAAAHYESPWLKDGSREVNLRTGQVLEQGGLFG